MKLILKNTSVVLLMFAAGFLFSSAGCRRKKDTVAKIYVVSSSGESVSGLEVRLVPVATEEFHNAIIPNRVSSTNRTGEAIFIFNDVYKLGQAGVAVMKIEVDKGTNTYTGIIKIDQEMTSEEKVVVP